MKEITMYQANDGTRFDSAEKAIDRDRVLDAINAIRILLPQQPVDKGCGFANGSGYIKADPLSVQQAKVLFTQLINSKLSKHGIEYPDFEHINGRTLEDYCTPLYKLHYDFRCIDSQNRMWGQMYFALNPLVGAQVEFTEGAAT